MKRSPEKYSHKSLLGLVFWFKFILLSILSCNKIEVPPPSVEEDVIFNARLVIGGDTLQYNTKNYEMQARSQVDTLGVRVFETKFRALQPGQSELAFIIRDQALFESELSSHMSINPGLFPTYSESTFAQPGYILENVLDQLESSRYNWFYLDQFFSGPVFNIEQVNPNRTYTICLDNSRGGQNTFSYYCKTFVPGHLKDQMDINIMGFGYEGNRIFPMIKPGTCCNLTYQWAGSAVSQNGFFTITNSGKYHLAVFGKNDHRTETELAISLENNHVPDISFVGFRSTLIPLNGTPNFGRSAIVFKSSEGKIYSSQYAPSEHAGVVRVIRSEDFEVPGDPQKRMKKITLRYDGLLQSKDGETLKVQDLRAQVGFVLN